MSRRLPLLLLLTVLLLGACGYRVPGADSRWTGGEGRRLYVELFANRTVEPYLDSVLTDEVAAELSRSRVAILTEGRADAELLLTGEVLSFDNRALAYDRDDEQALLTARLAIRARLIRLADGAVLWQGELSRSERYPASIDKGLQLESERLAAQVAARRLAEDLHARLLDAF